MMLSRAQLTALGGWDKSEDFAGDHGGRCRAVEDDRAVLKHLSFEYGPARTDLLAPCFAAARWVKYVMRHEPGFLGRPVNTEQEHAVEKLQKFVLVAGDATDENWPAVTSQDPSSRDRLRS